MKRNERTATTPKAPDPDQELVALIRALAFCPAVGDAEPAVLAARAWVDQQNAKPLDLAPKRPQRQA